MVKEIPEEYAEAVRDLDLAVYRVDGAYAVGKVHFGQSDIERFRDSGDFGVCEYPYK